jgi:hypothetical protein
MVGDQQFTCKIELSKSGGITIIIQDSILKEMDQRKIVLEAAALTLTVSKNGQTTTVTQSEASIKSEVKGLVLTSTILQDSENVTVTCKNFKVDADSVTLKAKMDGHFETGTTCNVKSTQATTIESSAGMTLKSVAAMALDAKESVSVKAVTNLTMEGAQTTLKGTTQLTAQSSGTTNVEGMTVTVKGNTQATVEAPVTSVGQSMTTIKGQMVEVSGALIKLG